MPKPKTQAKVPGSGRPKKYQDPVDRSIRMEREHWEEIVSLCPHYMQRLGSWSDKVLVVLELAREAAGEGESH